MKQEIDSQCVPSSSESDCHEGIASRKLLGQLRKQEPHGLKRQVKPGSDTKLQNSSRVKTSWSKAKRTEYVSKEVGLGCTKANTKHIIWQVSTHHVEMSRSRRRDLNHNIIANLLPKAPQPKKNGKIVFVEYEIH